MGLYTGFYSKWESSTLFPDFLGDSVGQILHVNLSFSLKIFQGVVGLDGSQEISVGFPLSGVLRLGCPLRSSMRKKFSDVTAVRFITFRSTLFLWLTGCGIGSLGLMFEYYTLYQQDIRHLHLRLLSDWDMFVAFANKIRRVYVLYSHMAQYERK